MPQTAQPRLTVAAAYSQAIDNFNAARYTEADKLCTAITQAVPNHIDAINLLGIIAQKLNRHDLAVEQFQRAIEIDSNRALLYFNLGTSLYPLGRREEAIKSLRIALKKEPGNSQIADYLNVVLQTGVNSAQHNAEETLQRGISFHQSGQMEEAIRWYRKTLAIQPEDPAALTNIGAALHSTGKLDEAAACHQKAIAIKPDFAEAYSNLGNTFKEQGKLDEAVTNYQKAISIKPDYAEAYSNLGVTLQKQVKLGEAVTSCQKAISIKPEYAEAYYNFGNILQNQRRLEEAVTNYQKAISIKPDYAEAYSNLGNVLQEQGKLEEAIKILQNASENDNYNRVIAGTIIDILNYYIPENETIGVHAKTQKLLQQVMAIHIDTPKLTNEAIQQLFQKSYEILEENNLSQEKYLRSQIYRGKIDNIIENPVYANCSRHTNVFVRYGIIPEHCFSCYKVTINPQTIVELFKLMIVFNNIKFPYDNTRKCIVETRPKVVGAYKGFIYCKNLKEAEEVYGIVKTIICEKISKDMPLTIKRGCSEFAAAYPEYNTTERDGSYSMIYNKDWRKYEENIDKDIVATTNPKINTYNHKGVTLRDAMVMRNWLSYAKMIGDSSYLNIYRNSVLPSPFEKRPPFKNIKTS